MTINERKKATTTKNPLNFFFCILFVLLLSFYVCLFLSFFSSNQELERQWKYMYGWLKINNDDFWVCKEQRDREQSLVNILCNIYCVLFLN